MNTNNFNRKFIKKIAFNFNHFFTINIFLVIFLLLCRSVNVKSQTRCNRGIECIPIKECDIIIQLLTEARKPLAPQIVNYLRNIQCALTNQGPMVCCPNSNSAQGTTSTSTTTYRTPVFSKPPITVPDLGTNNPDVYEDFTDHPNINLIPSTICGNILFIDKLSGGNSTALSQYPWMALLQYDSSAGLQHLCGGSLISDRYVLTAGHCIKNDLVSVRLGEYDLSKTVDCEITEDGQEICADPVQDIRIQTIIKHPKYVGGKFANDIALLRLVRKANLIPENVKPICLPITAELQRTTLKQLKVAGWGTTEKKRGSDVLLQANVPFVSLSSCQTVFRRYVNLTNSQLCAGGELGVDSCKGDSGGPLIFPGKLFGLRFIQYGVVSFGVNTCSLDTVAPGVYTKVSYYMRWILDQMQP